MRKFFEFWPLWFLPCLLIALGACSKNSDEKPSEASSPSVPELRGVDLRDYENLPFEQWPKEARSLYWEMEVGSE